MIRPRLRFKTERYVVDDYVEGDQAFVQKWLADERVARGLARPPVMIDAAEANELALSHDARTSVMLMIRPKQDGNPIGLWMVETRQATDSIWLSVMIGEAGGLRQGALLETAVPLFEWIGSLPRFQRIEASVAEDNAVMIAFLDRWMTRRNEGHELSSGSSPSALNYVVDRSDWPSALTRARNALAAGSITVAR